jgi:hypothetical protein
MSVSLSAPNAKRINKFTLIKQSLGELMLKRELIIEEKEDIQLLEKIKRKKKRSKVSLLLEYLSTDWIGSYPGSSNAGGFNANVQTLGNYNYDHSSRAGEQKVARINNKETTVEKLQKIAMNSDKLDTMPCMQSAKDRRFVEELRDPAVFNMMTFDREYGGIPK